MVIRFCPKCNQTYTVSSNSGDYVHKCESGNPIFDEEDELALTDTYQDIDGATKSTGRMHANKLIQGVENKLTGIARYEGGKLHDHTKKGKIKSTHYQKSKDVYIEHPEL